MISYRLLLITVVIGILSLFACNKQNQSPLAEFDDQDTHLYLLAGQSNMSGRDTPDSVDLIAHPRVYVLNRELEWEFAVEPLQFDKPQIAGTGPGLTFGKAMAAAFPDKIIGLIPVAVGGTAISFWEPGAYHEETGLYPWDRATSRLETALEEGQLKGIIWLQGESDCTPDRYPLYKDRLSNLIARFRTHTKQDSLPFVMGELSHLFVKDRLPEDSTAWYINQQVLPTVLDELPFVGLISSQGATMIPEDPIHYSAPGSRLLGRRFAQEMIRLLQE